MNEEMNKIEELEAQTTKEKIGFFAKHKRVIVITLISLVLISCLLFATVAYIVPAVKYGNALDDIENGNYKDAYITLKTLGNYKDSKEILNDFKLIYLREEKLGYDEYEDLVSTEIIELNELGETRLRVRYDEDGEIRYKEEYDENGNEIYFIDYIKDDYDEYILLDKREYNENGDITSEYSKNLGSRIYKHEYEYDAYGRLISSTEYIKERNTEETNKYQYEYKFFNGRLYRVLANGKELYAYDDKGRLKSASTLRGGAIKSKTEYDENGNKTLELKYGFAGKLQSKIAWENCEKTLEEKYNSGEIQQRTVWENGNKTLKEEYLNGVLEKKTVWKYNEKGKTSLCEAYTINADKTALILSSKKEYDENGSETLRISYDADGTVKNRLEKTYDANGKITLMVSYDGNGELTGKSESTYNADGKLLTEIKDDGSGNVTSKQEYGYDSDGNITFYNRYSINKVNTDEGVKIETYSARSEYEYDGKGRETYFANYDIAENGEETLQRRNITNYDKYGNVVYESTYENGRPNKTNEIEYVLEYDSDGFVISKVTYINGVLRSEIKYTDPIVLYEPKESE